jgi:hypothetical protein
MPDSCPTWWPAPVSFITGAAILCVALSCAMVSFDSSYVMPYPYAQPPAWRSRECNLCGPYSLTCLAWVALPGGLAPASLALRVVEGGSSERGHSSSSVFGDPPSPAPVSFPDQCLQSCGVKYTFLYNCRLWLLDSSVKEAHCFQNAGNLCFLYIFLSLSLIEYHPRKAPQSIDLLYTFIVCLFFPSCSVLGCITPLFSLLFWNSDIIFPCLLPDTRKSSSEL